MKLSVTVKTGKKATKVTRDPLLGFIVEVSARPQHGKANDAVISALADHFDVPESRIRIVSGHTSKKKLIEVLN